MNPLSPVYVAGGDTLIGAAILAALQERGFMRLVGMPPDEPDLANPGQVEDFFSEYRPEYVIMAGGRSGGIGLNRRQPADLMLDNLLSTAHVLQSAHANGVKKLLYLASSCAYPRLAPQPLAVESLLAGPVEPTSAAYATAKIAGWQLCEAFRRQFRRSLPRRHPGQRLRPRRRLRRGRRPCHPLPPSAAPTRPASATNPSWSSGAPARRAASSSSPPISPAPASSSWTTTKAASSTWAAAAA